MNRLRTGLATLVALTTLAVGPIATAQTASPKPKSGGAPNVTAAEAILVNYTDDNQVLFTRSARIPRAGPGYPARIRTWQVHRSPASEPLDCHDLADTATKSLPALQLSVPSSGDCPARARKPGSRPLPP